MTYSLDTNIYLPGIAEDEINVCVEFEAECVDYGVVKSPRWMEVELKEISPYDSKYKEIDFFNHLGSDDFDYLESQCLENIN